MTCAGRTAVTRTERTPVQQRQVAPVLSSDTDIDGVVGRLAPSEFDP